MTQSIISPSSFHIEFTVLTADVIVLLCVWRFPLIGLAINPFFRKSDARRITVLIVRPSSISLISNVGNLVTTIFQPTYYSFESGTNDKMNKITPASTSAILNHSGISPVGITADATDGTIEAAVRPRRKFIMFPSNKID